MEKKMMMPANYNVMNEEEMTYTSGGSVVGAVSAVASTAFGIWGLYNYYKGMVATRNYIKANKSKDTAALIDGGVETYVNYLQSNLINAFKGICAGATAVSLFPITALCVITA